MHTSSPHGGSSFIREQAVDVPLDKAPGAAANLTRRMVNYHERNAEDAQKKAAGS
jgi:hypothetical protein